MGCCWVTLKLSLLSVAPALVLQPLLAGKAVAAPHFPPVCHCSSSTGALKWRQDPGGV